MPDPLYVGASTKAYLGFHQTLAWLEGVRHEVAQRSWLQDRGIVPFVVPAFPALERAVQTAGLGELVGAQDVARGKGAYTGEVPASMLAELGVTIVEIGHAERREAGDTDEVVARKYRAAVGAGLLPLLCVGEKTPLNPTDAAGFAFEQLCSVLPESASDEMLIAYEPVWAIGADNPADPAFVCELIDVLRDLIGSRFAALEPSFLYGGSARPGTLTTMTGLDGVFLGRFAHDSHAFGTVLDEAGAIRGLNIAAQA